MELTKEDLQQAYITSVLDNNDRPKSVYRFSKTVQTDEADFYHHYASLNAIETDICSRFFDKTLENLEKQAVYNEYSAREKLLAFCYTLIEVAKEQRSYLKLTFPDNPMALSLYPKLLSGFKRKFIDYGSDLVQEGVGSHEIESRLFISNQYSIFLWNVVVFVLFYWLKDESKDFERTDTFIEKTVNLAFDIIGRTAFDSAFDLAKFLLNPPK